MVIQFDNGTIWHRDMGPPPRSVRVRARRAQLR
jgi:ribosomal protein L31E